jgi:hypothetical protein
MRNAILAMTILVCGMKSFAGTVECGTISSILTSDKASGSRVEVLKSDKSTFEIYVKGQDTTLVQTAYVSASSICKCDTEVNGVSTEGKAELRKLQIVATGRSSKAIQAALVKEGLGCE